MAKLYFRIYDIKHDVNLVEELTEKLENQELRDLEHYLAGLFETVREKESHRKFNLPDEDTILKRHLSSIKKDGILSEIGLGLAERLMRIELDVQKKLRALGKEIQKGLLIVAESKLEEGGGNVLIIKADHNEFLDQGDFKVHAGLPLKKKIYKAFIAEYDSDGELQDIRIYDTNPNISKYWWANFLELETRFNNSHNSETAFKLINDQVLSKVRKESKMDYYILRNATIKKFRSEGEGFDLELFADELLDNYNPHSEKLDIKKVKSDVLRLTNSDKFDTRFDIDGSGIKAREFNRILKINESLELHLKGEVKNIHDLIKPHKENGLKYIKIRSDKAYREFGG